MQYRHLQCPRCPARGRGETALVMAWFRLHRWIMHDQRKLPGNPWRYSRAD